MIFVLGGHVDVVFISGIEINITKPIIFWVIFKNLFFLTFSIAIF